MTEQHLFLNAKNLGPVSQAQLELRPLTLLIGPNNSGKSYIAKMIHALNSALISNPLLSPLDHDPFVQYLDSIDPILTRKPFGSLPDDQRVLYQDAYVAEIAQLQQRVQWFILDYFGLLELNGLSNRRSNTESIDVEFGVRPGRGASLVIRLSSDGPQLNIPPLEALQLPVLDKTVLGVDPSTDGFEWRLRRWLWSGIFKASAFPQGEIYYLPGGRSGLMAGAQVVAAAAISIVGQRAGLERIELAPLTGVEGEFVRKIIQGIPADTNLLSRKDWTYELASALQLLEETMRGQILVSQRGPGRPVPIYRRDELELPLGHSSSMVAELAPVSLWIKAFLRRGDLLIVDEPEAHLHPENQRLIARVLVRLVNAGVRVLCTTHSSLILHQISNCMMASRIGAEDRDALGLVATDAVAFDNVAAYLFEEHKNGSVVSRVDVDSEFGISEDEFVRVAESIGEETYNLKVASLDNQLTHAGG